MFRPHDWPEHVGFHCLYKLILTYMHLLVPNIYIYCTITLITMFVLTYSVRYVILFREKGVVHRITQSLSYFILFIY